MAHPGSGGTDGLPLVIPIGVDQEKRRILALLHQELTQVTNLLLGQGILRMRLRTDRTIDVIP